MTIEKAIRLLANFFKVRAEIFRAVSKESLIEWASDVARPGYRLSYSQYQFLIGRG